MMGSVVKKHRPLMLKDFLMEDQDADCHGFPALSKAGAVITVRQLLDAEIRKACEKRPKSALAARISAVVRLLPFSSTLESSSYSSMKLLGGRKKKRKLEMEAREPPPRDDEACAAKTTPPPLPSSASSPEAPPSSSSVSSPEAPPSPPPEKRPTDGGACDVDAATTARCRPSPKDDDDDERAAAGDCGEKSSMGSICNGDCDQEKEQLSPVSVMGFCSEDEGEEEGEAEEDVEEEQTLMEDSSSFYQSLANIERTRHNLLEKIRRFESLAHLVEPMDLDEKTFEDEEEEEEEKGEAVIQDMTKEKTIANALLEEFKKEMRSSKHVDRYDGLLTDFFIQGLSGSGRRAATAWQGKIEREGDRTVKGGELLRMTWEWARKGRVNGDKAVDWEERWGCLVDEEEGGVAEAVGVGVFESMLDELVVDLTNIVSV